MQKWFYLDPVVSNAYIISSTYQGGQAGTKVKIMAINLSDGKVEAIDQNFSGISAYVLKVKNEEPEWVVWQNKSTSKCLSSKNGVLESVKNLKTESCPDSFADKSIIANKYKWLYEPKTGYLRSYIGQCVYADQTDNWQNVKISDCGSNNKYRWVGLLNNGDYYTFETASKSGRYFWDHDGQVDMWNYGLSVYDDGKWNKK